MNNLPISLSILAIGMILSASTCSNDNTRSQQALAKEAQGKWVLVSLQGTAIPLTQEAEEAPYITLDSTATSISGYGGCNRLLGEVFLSHDSISFARLGSTKMYCEGRQEMEDAFLGALREANRFTITDDRLTLLDQKKELAQLKRNE